MRAAARPCGRSPACLRWSVRGAALAGACLQLPIWAFPVKWENLMRPDWIKPGTRVLNQWRLGPRLPAKYSSILRSNRCSSTTPIRWSWPRSRKNHRGPRARRPFHRGQRAFPHRHRQLRRHRSACHHADGAVRHHVLLGAFLSVAQPTGDLAARGGGTQHRAVPATGRSHGLR